MAITDLPISFTPIAGGDFPDGYASRIAGGLHVQSTTTNRNSIPDYRREEGMLCWVTAGLGAMYRLKASPWVGTDADWVEVVSSAGGFSAFVFKPGATPVANQYNDFATLITALNLVRGPRVLVMDNDIAAIVIPAATYAFDSQVDIYGIERFSGTGGTTWTVNLAAVFTNVRSISNCTMAVGGSAVRPIRQGNFGVPFANGSITLENFALSNTTTQAAIEFTPTLVTGAKIRIKGRLTINSGEIFCFAAGVTYDLFIEEGIVFPSNVIEGAGTVNVFLSQGATFSTTQTSFSGTFNVTTYVTPMFTVQDEGGVVSAAVHTINVTNTGASASLTSPGVVEINVPGAAGADNGNDPRFRPGGSTVGHIYATWTALTAALATFARGFYRIMMDDNLGDLVFPTETRDFKGQVEFVGIHYYEPEVVVQHQTGGPVLQFGYTPGSNIPVFQNIRALRSLCVDLAATVTAPIFQQGVGGVGISFDWGGSIELENVEVRNASTHAAIKLLQNGDVRLTKRFVRTSGKILEVAAATTCWLWLDEGITIPNDCVTGAISSQLTVYLSNGATFGTQAGFTGPITIVHRDIRSTAVARTSGPVSQGVFATLAEATSYLSGAQGLRTLIIDSANGPVLGGSGPIDFDSQWEVVGIPRNFSALAELTLPWPCWFEDPVRIANLGILSQANQGTPSPAIQFGDNVSGTTNSPRCLFENVAINHAAATNPGDPAFIKVVDRDTRLIFRGDCAFTIPATQHLLEAATTFGSMGVWLRLEGPGVSIGSDVFKGTAACTLNVTLVNGASFSPTQPDWLGTINVTTEGAGMRVADATEEVVTRLTFGTGLTTTFSAGPAAGQRQATVDAASALLVKEAGTTVDASVSSMDFVSGANVTQISPGVVEVVVSGGGGGGGSDDGFARRATQGQNLYMSYKTALLSAAVQPRNNIFHVAWWQNPNFAGNKETLIASWNGGGGGTAARFDEYGFSGYGALEGGETYNGNDISFVLPYQDNLVILVGPTDVFIVDMNVGTTTVNDTPKTFSGHAAAIKGPAGLTTPRVLLSSPADDELYWIFVGSPTVNVVANTNFTAGDKPKGLCFDSKGRLWVATPGTNEIHRYAVDYSVSVADLGTKTTYALSFNGLDYHITSNLIFDGRYIWGAGAADPGITAFWSLIRIDPDTGVRDYLEISDQIPGDLALNYDDRYQFIHFDGELIWVPASTSLVSRVFGIEPETLALIQNVVTTHKPHSIYGVPDNELDLKIIVSRLGVADFMESLTRVAKGYVQVQDYLANDLPVRRKVQFLGNVTVQDDIYAKVTKVDVLTPPEVVPGDNGSAGRAVRGYSVTAPRYIEEFDDGLTSTIGDMVMAPQVIATQAVTRLIVSTDTAGTFELNRVTWPYGGSSVLATTNDLATFLMMGGEVQAYVYAVADAEFLKVDVNSGAIVAVYTANVSGFTGGHCAQANATVGVGSSWIYITSPVDDCLYRVSLTEPTSQRPTIFTFGVGDAPKGICVDGDGFLWVAVPGATEVHRFSIDYGNGDVSPTHVFNALVTSNLIFDGKYVWGCDTAGGNMWRFAVGTAALTLSLNAAGINTDAKIYFDGTNIVVPDFNSNTKFKLVDPGRAIVYAGEIEAGASINPGRRIVGSYESNENTLLFMDTSSIFWMREPKLGRGVAVLENGVPKALRQRISFIGAEVQDYPAGDSVTVDLALTTSNEGSSVEQVTRSYDFVGAGVTATQTAVGFVEVNIPGVGVAGLGDNGIAKRAARINGYGGEYGLAALDLGATPTAIGDIAWANRTYNAYLMLSCTIAGVHSVRRWRYWKDGATTQNFVTTDLVTHLFYSGDVGAAGQALAGVSASEFHVFDVSGNLASHTPGGGGTTFADGHVAYWATPVPGNNSYIYVSLPTDDQVNVAQQGILATAIPLALATGTGSAPKGMVVDRFGKMWIACPGTNEILACDVASGTGFLTIDATLTSVNIDSNLIFDGKYVWGLDATSAGSIVRIDASVTPYVAESFNVNGNAFVTNAKIYFDGVVIWVPGDGDLLYMINPDTGGRIGTQYFGGGLQDTLRCVGPSGEGSYTTFVTDGLTIKAFRPASAVDQFLEVLNATDVVVSARKRLKIIGAREVIDNPSANSGSPFGRIDITVLGHHNTYLNDVTGVTPYVVLVTDEHLVVDPEVGGQDITLPAVGNGWTVTVTDALGSAATDNITISPPGGDTIAGAGTYVISANYGSVTLRKIRSTVWAVIAQF